MMRKFKKILSDYEDNSIVDPYLIEQKYYHNDAAEISAMHDAHYGFTLNLTMIIGVCMFLSLFHSIITFVGIYLFFILPMVVFLRSIERKCLRYDDISYKIWLKEMKYFGSNSMVV